MIGLLTVLLCLFLLGGVILAQASPQYGLSWSVIAGGGGSSHSPNYAVSGTIGQGVAGLTTSSHYLLGAGYWYGFTSPAQPQQPLYLPVMFR